MTLRYMSYHSQTLAFTSWLSPNPNTSGCLLYYYKMAVRNLGLGGLTLLAPFVQYSPNQKPIIIYRALKSTSCLLFSWGNNCKQHSILGVNFWGFWVGTVNKMFTQGVFFKLLRKSSLCNHVIVAVCERNIRVLISQPTQYWIILMFTPTGLVWTRCHKNVSAR